MGRSRALLLLVFLVPVSLHAQGTSHGFVSVGAGATDLDGGAQWVSASRPIGIGGEIGLGWSFMAAIDGSYHLLRSDKHDVFASVGYAELGSSEFSSHGVKVGGGATYWPAGHLGIRFDGFKFLPVATKNDIPAADRSPSQYWGLRAGVAFRFH